LRREFSGVRVRLSQFVPAFRGDDFAAFIAGFRSEIDDPIGALNHFEIVLDHDERMPAIDQALE
jgi:hypothetical protein